MRVWRAALGAGLIALGLTAGPLQAAHITDKLAAGVYEQPDDSTAPLKAVPSGTPLEVIQRKGEFIQVRLPDGDEGWVKAEYVTDQKPARVMLLEAQAKAREAETHQAAAEEALAKLREETERDRVLAQQSSAKQTETVAHLKTQLSEAQQRVAELENKLREAPGPSDSGSATPTDDQASQLQAALDSVRTELRAANGTIEELKAQLAEARSQTVPKITQAAPQQAEPAGTESSLSESGAGDAGWIWPCLAFALLIGFIAGVAALDYLQRRRHGGFRV